MTCSILRQRREEKRSLCFSLSLLFYSWLCTPLPCPLSMSPWSTSSVIKSFMLLFSSSCCAATLGWLAWDLRDEDEDEDLPFPLQCNLPRMQPGNFSMLASSLRKRPSNVAFISHTLLLLPSLSLLPALLVGNFIYFFFVFAQFVIYADASRAEPREHRRRFKCQTNCRHGSDFSGSSLISLVIVVVFADMPCKNKSVPIEA